MVKNLKIAAMPRIHWKEGERHTVALRAAELAEQSTSKKRVPWVDTIMQAQDECLAPERRRPKSSLSSAQGMGEKFRLLGRKLLAEKNEANQQLPAEPISEPVQEPEVHQELARPASEPSHDGYRYDEMIDHLVDEIGAKFKVALSKKLNIVVNEVLRNVHDQINSKLVDLNPQLPSNRGHSPYQAPGSKIRKDKVLLLGINVDQANDMKKDYAQFFDLEHVVNEKMNQVKGLLGHARFVVVNTANISHNTMDKIKNHPGLKRASGGSGAMKEVLVELARQTHL